MALPASVEYGDVKWRAVSAVADSNDPDTNPDAVPVTGTVTFTPSATVLLAPAGAPPVTVIATPVSYELDDNGVLRDNSGRDSVTLVATDSAGLTPTGWTWTVSYRLNGGLQRGSFSFELPAGTTVDLTTVAPVGASGGAQIVQGPAGPSGGTLSTEEMEDLVAGLLETGAALQVTEPFLDVRALGVVADGVTDDSDAWDDVHAAVSVSGNAKGIRLPIGTSLVSRPVRIPAGVSIEGYGSWSHDSYHSPSKFQAAPAFVGNSVVQQERVGLTGDQSMHWAVWERFCVEGLGAGTGPNGVNPGWSGEAFSIRNVMVTDCASGFYVKDSQASLHMDSVSASSCTYGINLDLCGSTIRLIGISGDDNTGALLRVKGGFDMHVTVIGMKAEAYVAGYHDPVILVDDLEGGYLGVFGGWAGTTVAHDSIVKIQKTTTVLDPRVELMGISADREPTGYTNLLEDTISGKTVPLQPNDQSRPHVLWNTDLVVGGSSSLLVQDSEGDWTDGLADTGGVTGYGVRVYLGDASQTIPYGSLTAVNYTAVDYNDSTDYYAPDLTANTVAVLQAGLYVLQAEVSFEAPSSVNERAFSLMVNGAQVRQASQGFPGFFQGSQTWTLRLAAGDDVGISVYMDGGGTLALRGGSALWTGLSIARLGD